ncbi:MAG TPA: NnrU family protein [Ktedonobacteraceae bacterium]|nr:NnrU family protein [Ktedonobacteraceae bacterium]
MATQTGMKKAAMVRGRTLALVYGAFCYLTFLITVLWAIGFVENLFFPKIIDAGPGASFINAVLIDTLLLALFAIQHSVMARSAFKKWWTRIIPSAIERSTYVLVASLLLLLLYWQWLPIPGTIWNVEQTAGGILLQALSWIGWLIVLLSTFLINHFDLFGLRQVYLNWRGIEYTPVDMKTPVLYKLVRHPLMLGFLIAFWATPHMTVGHFLFSGASTGYILVGIYLEERDLLATHGEAYRRYQQRVSRLLPVPKKQGLPAERGTEDKREKLS